MYTIQIFLFRFFFFFVAWVNQIFLFFFVCLFHWLAHSFHPFFNFSLEFASIFFRIFSSSFLFIHSFTFSISLLQRLVFLSVALVCHLLLSCFRWRPMSFVHSLFRCHYLSFTHPFAIFRSPSLSFSTSIFHRSVLSLCHFLPALSFPLSFLISI